MAIPWKNLASVGAVLAIFAGVSLLPPDTSLAEVERIGLLRVCTPVSYPPLVTGNPDEPGIDVEILTAIAGELGLRLSFEPNPAIGRDFNPRNWGLTRARCQIVAGGVVASPTTRSFMETALPHGETGWASVGPEDLPSLTGVRVGVLVGISGLDRIALSSYLRAAGAESVVFRDTSSLVAAIESGDVAVGIAEALTARQIASDHDWTADMLPDTLPRYDVVFGLWKGDLTLKRRLEAIYRDLEASGQIAAIEARYFGDAEPPSGQSDE